MAGHLRKTARPVSDTWFCQPRAVTKASQDRHERRASAQHWTKAAYSRTVPRRQRLFEAGIYHLAARGSDNRFLFLGRDDREDFLDRLGRACARFELGLISYVLMGSHYHALLRVPGACLSRALRHLHTEYSRHHNRRHRRSGHLFRAHPTIREIDSDEHLLTAARYLALNPVVASLVRDPFDWPWSSARAHAGLDSTGIALAEGDLEAAFGGEAPSWRSRYRDFVVRRAVS